MTKNNNTTVAEAEKVFNNPTETTEIVTVTDIPSTGLVDSLLNPTASFYCSIVDDGTRASKAKIVNAMNNADEELKEHVNEVLEIVDVCAYPVTVVSEETGELMDALRTILIDKDGNNYFATSAGVVNCLQKIFAIIGAPDNGAWHDEPVKMKVKRKSTRNGGRQVTTLELVF